MLGYTSEKVHVCSSTCDLNEKCPHPWLGFDTHQRHRHAASVALNLHRSERTKVSTRPSATLPQHLCPVSYWPCLPEPQKIRENHSTSNTVEKGSRLLEKDRKLLVNKQQTEAEASLLPSFQYPGGTTKSDTADEKVSALEPRLSCCDHCHSQLPVGCQKSVSFLSQWTEQLRNFFECSSIRRNVSVLIDGVELVISTFSLTRREMVDQRLASNASPTQKPMDNWRSTLSALTCSCSPSTNLSHTINPSTECQFWYICLSTHTTETLATRIHVCLLLPQYQSAARRPDTSTVSRFFHNQRSTCIKLVVRSKNMLGHRERNEVNPCHGDKVQHVVHHATYLP